MRITPRPFAALGALLVAATFAAPAGSQSPPAVKVAYIAVDDEAEAMYAKSAGIFAKAGLNVELQPMPNAGAIAQAVASNAVEIGYLPTVPIAIAHAKKVPLVIVAPGSVFDGKEPITSLFTAPGSPLKKAADLNGKTIAVPGLGSIAEFGARAWIDKNGGDAASVKFVEIPFPAMPQALRSGRVDAAMITEPFLTVAKKNEQVLAAMPFAAIAPSFAFGAWVTTAQWAKDHPAVVSRFAAAMRETAAWANANHAASGKILAQFTKIDAQTAATMSRSSYAERISAQGMQPVVDLAARYAHVPSFPASELIDVPRP